MSFFKGLFVGSAPSPEVTRLEGEKTAAVAEKEAEKAAVTKEYDDKIAAATAAGAKASSDTPPSGPGTAPIGGRRRKTRKGKSRGGKKSKSRKSRK